MKGIKILLFAVLFAATSNIYAQKQKMEELGPYTVEVMQKGVYHITDYNSIHPEGNYIDKNGNRASNNCSDMYLVLGSEKALLVDLSNWIEWDSTAVESLRKLVYDRVGKRELIITLTHSHGDHTGMLPAFKNDPRAKFVLPALDFMSGAGSIVAHTYPLPEFPKDRTFYMDDEAVFDLGNNVKVKGLYVSGHTPGSMVFFIEGENICFSGDAFGVWIFSYDGFIQQRKSVDHFIAYVEDPANGIDPSKLAIWSGHSWQKKKFGIVGMQYVYDMRTLIDQIGKYEAKSEVVHYFPYLNRTFSYGQAELTWNADDALRYAEEIRFPKEKDFVGKGPTHKDSNFDLPKLFDEYTYSDAKVGDMKYYLYDPIKHGADPSKKYPMIVVFHGANNGKNGVICTVHTDCAVYAGAEYQKMMGGAYILFPKANEGSEDNSEPVVGTWMTPDPQTGKSIYVPAVTGIIKKVASDNSAIDASHIVVGGTSAGGYMTWHFLSENPELPCAAFLMAPAGNPTDEDLEKYDALNLPMWIIHGVQDEICLFDKSTGMNMEKFAKMKNVRVSPIQTVRYGDKGIVRMVVGVEMGQHLALFCVGANMIYDDGTPYDLRYPDGFISWLNDVFKIER